MNPMLARSLQRDACRMLVLAGLPMLTACQFHQRPTIFDDPSAMAVLSPTSGSSAHGVVTFVRKGDGTTLVTANLSGFKPDSLHGMHIHERGDCSARDASSAGDHFNPTGSAHGAPESAQHHAGDLGNVEANHAGQVYEIFEVPDGAFGTGEDSIIGRGLIVHAERDDFSSQPAGNAGARLACGMITRNPDRMAYVQRTAP